MGACPRARARARSPSPAPGRWDPAGPPGSRKGWGRGGHVGPGPARPWFRGLFCRFRGWIPVGRAAGAEGARGGGAGGRARAASGRQRLGRGLRGWGAVGTGGPRGRGEALRPPRLVLVAPGPLLPGRLGKAVPSHARPCASPAASPGRARSERRDPRRVGERPESVRGVTRLQGLCRPSTLARLSSPLPLSGGFFRGSSTNENPQTTSTVAGGVGTALAQGLVSDLDPRLLLGTTAHSRFLGLRLFI